MKRISEEPETHSTAASAGQPAEKPDEPMTDVGAEAIAKAPIRVIPKGYTIDPVTGNY